VRRERIQLQARVRALARNPPPVVAEPPREWRGRVAAAWTLVARFDLDGERYLLAREKDPLATARALLSPRELDVMLALAHARSNKQIAAALGIAPSTVGVLLSRAAKKLRLTTREALTELAQRLATLPPS
jgi:DNA-binding CsgD family transcriptional regulator